MASPYELLVGLALLREKKRRLEATQQGPLEAWSALVVKVGSQHCLIRQDEVDEVIAPGKLTPVLGMPAWMKGIAYFRSHLLNVIDGKNFFLNETRTQLSATGARILAVQGQNEWFGLSVDELVGIRHIWSDSARVMLLTADAKAKWHGFAQYAVELEGGVMPLLQIKQLAADLEQRGIPDQTSDSS